MPCSGMKSSVPARRGAATGCVLMRFMVALSSAPLKRDSLRGLASSRPNG
jgi:hypothetical protein